MFSVVIVDYKAMKAVQVNPNQKIAKKRTPKITCSLESRSATTEFCECTESPNIAFIQVRKKNVGIKKYNITTIIMHNTGRKSKQNVKNRNSAIKKIVPGKPKKTTQLKKQAKNSLGQRKLIPEISEINRVLKRLLIESTSINDVVEISA
jgi:hypothetical protein